VYLVTVRGSVDDDTLSRLTAGVTHRGEILRAASATLVKVSGRESQLTIALREGKNREIRRMFESMGREVTRLKRVAFGPLQLGDLPPGRWREITRGEIVRAFGGPALGRRAGG
jgi:23S rRNA pseudouridine2605 synthase